MTHPCQSRGHDRELNHRKVQRVTKLNLLYVHTRTNSSQIQLQALLLVKFWWSELFALNKLCFWRSDQPFQKGSSVEMTLMSQSIVGVKLRYSHKLFGPLQRPLLFCCWLKALFFFCFFFCSLFFSLCASVDPTSDERVNTRTHSSPLHLLIYLKRLAFRSQRAFSSLKSLLFFSLEFFRGGGV